MVEKDILIYSYAYFHMHCSTGYNMLGSTFPASADHKILIKDAQDFKPLCLYSQIHRSFKRSTKKRERECVKYILGIYHGCEG